MDVIQVIKDQIEKNPVILYMKGTPQFPQCGFSAQVVEAMTAVGKPFAYVNILEAPEIRQSLKEYANWPAAATSLWTCTVPGSSRSWLKMPQWMPTPAITPDSVVLPRTKDPASRRVFLCPPFVCS